MKLYDVPMSPNSRLAKLIAYETDVKVEIVPIDFSKGTHKQPDFLKMNPNGKIPVLKDDGFVLWESNAIACYLAAQRPNIGLIPTDVKGRAQVDQWLFWKTAHFGPAIGKINFERLIKQVFNLGAPDEATIALGFKELEQFATVLDSHLAKHEFVANDRLSVADFSLACSFMYRELAKVDIGKWKNIGAWLKRIESRPSWAATAPKT